ncbi:MAG: hypothetical protein JW861_07710, partial [Bacteroidales bacterium]|nr:hypothetical protein [Bacteroidales bacterium]
MPLQTLLNHHQVSRKEWDELVRSCPGGNIFQTPLMFEFFDEIPRYESLAVFIADNGRLVGVCTCVVMREREKGWLGRLTSRAIIWGGPVVDENHPARNDIHTRLIDGIIHITRKRAIYTEFRNLFDLSIFQNFFMKRGFRFIPWLNFIVDTGSEQDVMKKISSGKIRQVKKGLKAGAEIIEPDDISQVRQFYNILEELYRTRVKKPLPPWEFFEKYFEFSLRSSEFRYLLVRFDEKIIGGMVCPVFGNKTIYEWFIAGNDASFREVYPSILAT